MDSTTIEKTPDMSSNPSGLGDPSDSTEHFGSRVTFDEQSDSHRVRKLTEEGQELYERTLDKLQTKMDSSWYHIESIAHDLNEDELEISALRQLKGDIQNVKKEFLDTAYKLAGFLKNTRSEESKKELISHSEEFVRKCAIISRLRRRIDEALLTKTETASLAHSGSKSSRSSVRRKKIMDAALEKKQLEFIKKEMELEQEKVKVEGQLQILKQTKVVAVAEAKARAAVDDDSDCSSNYSVPSLGVLSRDEKVENYLSGIGTDGPTNTTVTGTNPSHPTTSPGIQDPYVTSMNHTPAVHSSMMTTPVFQPKLTQDMVTSSYCTPPTIPPPVVSTAPHSSRINPTETSTPPQLPDNVTVFSNYLMKKDLMISRFTNFTDEPEAYNSWKMNFESVIRELSVSPFEEIQLLVRWLGPESSKYASNIRQANADNPSEGVRMIWNRLNDRYGAAEYIDSSLKGKLAKFPYLTVKDSKRLFDLADILTQIDGIKKNPKYFTMFSYYDSPVGIIPIVSKLPHPWREKWTSKASEYKAKLGVPYPPFTIFVNFIQDLSRTRNDPGFQYEDKVPKKNEAKSIRIEAVHSRKTDIDHPSTTKCPLHPNEFHDLRRCRKFRSLPIVDRKKIIKENNLCYRCCDSNHLARNCKEMLTCDTCNANHATALHPLKKDGGEKSTRQETVVDNKCTIICGDNFPGKSCAKTLLVSVYPTGRRDQSRRLYAILDDQSSQTLAKPKFFEMFNINDRTVTYTLSTCSGTVSTTGRCGSNFVVEPINDGNTVNLSRVIECEDIPTNKDEIPSPGVARAYTHLSDIAAEIPDIDEDADILLLIGRDHPDAHHVLSQKTGPRGSPFAQKLPFGWAIIGECCLGKVHQPSVIVANKTHILPSGQGTTFPPCPTHRKVIETDSDLDGHNKQDPIFKRTREDDEPGLSVEDREFLHIMDNECYRDQDGHWTAPLPFRKDRPDLPNNRDQAVKRMRSLTSSFKKTPTKRDDAIKFMDRLLRNGHAEKAPPLKDGEECWFLPIFGVYHPHKPTQIRMVFDASASFAGTSLNSVLLPGPNMTNNLLGILLRFRKERVAVVGDIEQMFHSFKIRQDHRNFVRFVWFEDNNPEKPLIDYRMCVHLFGNSPSPAVATYCLRKCVAGDSCDAIIKEFVDKNFYVDDGLVSFTTREEALDVLLRTQTTLKEEGRVRFHKFASNNQDVMDALPPEDRAKDLSDIDLELSSAPTQRSLGLGWNLESDSFVFNFVPKDPQIQVTKREILSGLNSLYDPLGFLSPVVLQGRFIFRDVVNSSVGWDDAVSPEVDLKWRNWCCSLHHLLDVNIHRMFVPTSLKQSDRIELHTFSDASEKAVSAVSYLRVISGEDSYVGFAFGKSKLSPCHGHTIPRLELCAAVLASEIAQFVCKQIDVNIHERKFYTDSRVVLGYIYNRTKRFHTYVSNRVQRIHLETIPEEWTHVSSEQNPADVGTRSCTADELSGMWLQGPSLLHNSPSLLEDSDYPLQSPEDDKEIRLETKMTAVSNSFGLSRFERFSSWKSAIRALVWLQNCVMKRQGRPSDYTKLYRSTEIYLIKILQKENFGQESAGLYHERPIPKDSPLRCLDTYLDDDGVIRVGGRFRTGDALSGQHGPIVIPGKTHLARLLVLHLHEKTRHQGRNILEGAVRSAGYWVIGAKRLVSSVIHACVVCRKLRRKLECQKMANLPEFRTRPTPPFTYVGVDTFGPWEVSTRKTRGGAANAKRWAILFTCMTSRAVHIELVEEMSSAAFINALRRFVSLRGKVTEFHSDRGTNFVGSTDALGINAINVENPTIKKFFVDNGSTWVFNPPHASHMGGVWERVIGTARRILEGIIVTESRRNLTHDILSTFMCEVCAIINSRPIAPVSVDPSQPSVLSPSTLLTQKTDLDFGPFEEIDIKDAYKSCWKHVQVMANQFWKRWQNEYLHSLQSRRKWIDTRDNIQKGDVVLLKEEGTVRYDWPLGQILRTFPGNDGKVRKVELKVVRNGKIVTNYVRPVTEIVYLFSC